MATSINKVILIGNVGNKPDLRFTPSGKSVLEISVATNEKMNDKSTGMTTIHTDWHKVCIYGKIANTLASYIKKGSYVYVEGRIYMKKSVNAYNNNYIEPRIIASNFRILDKLDKKEINEENEEFSDNIGNLI